MARPDPRMTAAVVIAVTVLGSGRSQVAPAIEPGDWEITDLDAGQTESPEIAFDAGGNAIAVWVGDQRIRTASFVAATQTWTPAITLSGPSDSGSDPRVAVNAGGEAVAVWDGVMSDQTTYIGLSRYSAATQTWGSPLVFPTDADWPDAVIDEHGNLTVVWAQVLRYEFGYCYYYYYFYCDPFPVHEVRSARYDAATAQWSSPIALSGEYIYSKPQIGIDPTGNVTLLWLRDAVVESRRWQSGGTSWSPVTRLLPMYPFSPQMIVDRHGNVVAVWNITGPSLYGARFSAKTGTWSAGVLVASSSDNGEASLGTDEIGNVTVAWTAGGRMYSRSYLPSTNGWAATTEIAGNVVSNTGRITVDPYGNATAIWLDANQVLNSARRPPGGGWGAAETVATSVEAPRIDSDVVGNVFLLWNSKAEPQPGLKAARWAGPLAPPSAPINLLGLADGDNLTLAWQNSPSGGAPSGNVLDVSGNLSGSIPLQLTEQFAFSGVPAGTYTFVVRATNGSGSSAPSNSVTLTFPGNCSPPHTPNGFVASRIGNTISAFWSPPSSGSAPTGYVLNVSGAINGAFPVTGLTVSSGVAPGTYTISVAATNQCGTSPPTAATTITIP